MSIGKATERSCGPRLQHDDRRHMRPGDDLADVFGVCGSVHQTIERGKVG